MSRLKSSTHHHSRYRLHRSQRKNSTCAVAFRCGYCGFTNAVPGEAIHNSLRCSKCERRFKGSMLLLRWRHALRRTLSVLAAR